MTAVASLRAALERIADFDAWVELHPTEYGCSRCGVSAGLKYGAEVTLSMMRALIHAPDCPVRVAAEELAR